MGDYVTKIDELIQNIPEEILNLNATRKRGQVPTQAFSAFLTNREQGDWAEELIFRAINELEQDILAVKYGKSDQVVAGEPGFKEFYESYQDELDTIGKRPDILIFKKNDFDSPNLDISKMEVEECYKILSNAIAGLEIRSSSFLVGGYEEHVDNKKTRLIEEIDKLITDLRPITRFLSKKWKIWLSNIDYDDLETFRGVPRISGRYPDDVKTKLKVLKTYLNELNKRNHLSFTPKVEDLLVIYKWIKTYGVPHYYIQVFFDKVYAISFKNILEIISNPDNNGKIFSIEKNAKNQFKNTIHIDINRGTVLAHKVDFPQHLSNIKRLGRGRLLFYISFEGGNAHLDVDNLYELLND